MQKRILLTDFPCLNEIDRKSVLPHANDQHIDLRQPPSTACTEEQDPLQGMQGIINIE